MLKAVLGLRNLRKSLPLSSSFHNSSINCNIKASEFFDVKLKKLIDEEISEPENSLELIFANVLKKEKLREVRGESLEKIELTEDQILEIEEKFLCRISKMPTQYILKEWEFRDIKLNMKIPVFIPRPETEELVELISQKLSPKKDYKILEIGCGSGCISLSLLNEHEAIDEIIAVDQSKSACELTLENAKKLELSHRLKVCKHKLENDGLLPADIVPLDLKFDLIISNPPYVPSKDILKLQPEIYLYEDIRALDGGKDGLDVINALLNLSANYLKPKGSLWLEIDDRHPEIIAKIVENNAEKWNLKFMSTYKDIFKKNRFVEIEKI